MLLSGGLDSAVLVVEEAAKGAVQPVYVGVGLAWEAAERAATMRFLEALPPELPVRPLVSLAVDMRDVYPPSHWAVRGQPPGYHTPDEEVYIPGRNVVLLGKAGVFCAAAGIPRIVLGTLGHNPFPDATPAFRTAMQAALSLGLACDLAIDAPYAHMTKAGVVRRGVRLGVPLGLTLSCMQPRAAGSDAVHCGACSKCRERHQAFVEAQVPDPTVYADPRSVSARQASPAHDPDPV